MRITAVNLAAFRGISSKLDLPFDNDGKNLLVYGENGSAKSSFAHALEFLFNPKACPEQSILGHKNLFVAAMPEIRVDFTGLKAGTRHDEPVVWTHASGKPTPSWLLSSAARSAFLDHRKLLMLSDRTHGNLPQRFFLTAVEHLFGNLSAGTSGETVASLWRKIQADVKAYTAAKLAKTGEADSGVADSVAHYKPIEDAVNELNTTLDDFLLRKGGRPPTLVTEAERLLKNFEGHGLTVALTFEHLTFNRATAAFGGGELTPEVTYCSKSLGAKMGDMWVSNHHEVLNEARLTALALALFFAAVRLQDQINYIPGATDPQQPSRLLVLDDILIGLDYAHRIPVLDVLTEEFAKNRHFQVILLTHDRVWFDVCRLQLPGADWKAVELYVRRGKGPGNSDFPIRKESPSDLLERARLFLDQYHEAPAAANYARSALEAALRNICEKRRVLIPFRADPEKHAAEVFITAIRDVKRRRGSSWNLIPLSVQAQLKALRTTVLNPLSHFNPTTVTEPDIRKAIALSERLNRIAKRITAQAEG